MIPTILTWTFVCFVTAFGTVILGATIILLSTSSTHPRWYIACLRAVGKRIGLE